MNVDAPPQERRGRHDPARPPLLLSVFPSFAVGGAQVRYTALANRFGSHWRHAVVALDGQTGCAERFAPEVPFRLLPPPFAPGAGPTRRLLAMAAMLRRLRPAVLVTSNWGSIEFAMANLAVGVPHLHTEDGFGPEERETQLQRRVLARRLVLRRSLVVLPSATLARLAAEVWQLPPGRVRLIRNGIDLRHFNPNGKAPRDPAEAPVIGTVAALRPEKNVARLLRAVALLHDEGTPARLLILGDGPERPALEELADSLGIGACTQFLGHVADPAEAYGMMDVFALSSDTEQMPFAVLEAMASGLPIASTDVGDVGLMLSDANRPHLAALDDVALAAALRPLLLEPALRNALGRANRGKVQLEHDEASMFASHAALIDGLLHPGAEPQELQSSASET